MCAGTLLRGVVLLWVICFSLSVLIYLWNLWVPGHGPSCRRRPARRTTGRTKGVMLSKPDTRATRLLESDFDMIFIDL